MTDPRPVVLIDLSAVFHQAYAVNPDEGAHTATLAKVRKLEGTYGDALVAICCDGRGNWRKDLAPTYKAQRQKLPESFYGLFDRVKAELRRQGYLLWTCDGFEADDIIATAVDAARIAGHPVTIATSDKDMYQLLGGDVVVFKLHTWETFNEKHLLDACGVSPAQFGDWLALVGDTSDNVPGCPGTGPKKATALLQKYGTLPAMYKALAAGDTSNGVAQTKALLDSMNQVAMAVRLVALRYDAPILFAEIYEKREPVKEPPTIEIVPDAPAYIDIGPAPTPPANETALAVANGLPFELQLQPMSTASAVGLAKRLHDSGLYSWLRNSDTVLAVISRGREVGLSAGAALDVFKPVEGRLCPGWQFIADRAEKDPNCEYFFCSESTATQATYKAKHRKNPVEQSLTYTLAEAQAAGLVKLKGAWEKYPGPMCRKMAAVHLARMVFPGSSQGLYATEEMEAA